MYSTLFILLISFGNGATVAGYMFDKDKCATVAKRIRDQTKYDASCVEIGKANDYISQGKF